MTTTTTAWKSTEDALADAKGIAWDGCHKIYVLLDDAAIERMRTNGYTGASDLVLGSSPEEYLDLIQAWFEDSCSLRFVESIRTVEGNPNAGFTSLIAQFEYDEDEDEDYED